jgi:hypothetical protein
MTIPELIANLSNSEWVALHLFGAIEALDVQVGLTPRMKRIGAFGGALGAPLLGYVLKLTTKVEAFDINAFLVTAGGGWLLATQVIHRIWQALENRAVDKAVTTTTALNGPPTTSLFPLNSGVPTMQTPPVNVLNSPQNHIVNTPRVGGGAN